MSKVIQSMFYNANYNLGYPDGQSKFIWGVQQIDFSKDIQKQLVGDQQVFNFNLTSLNPIFDPYHDENKLVEENQRLTAIATKHATRADELYELMLEINKFGNKIIGPALCLAEVDYPMSAQAVAANTDWNEIQHKIKLILDKSRIEAEKGDGICN